MWDRTEAKSGDKRVEFRGVCVCLSVCLYFCLPAYVYVSLGECMSLCVCVPFVYLCLCMSVCKSFPMLCDMGICSSMYVLLYMCVHPCMCVCNLLCTCICLYVYVSLLCVCACLCHIPHPCGVCVCVWPGRCLELQRGRGGL